MNNYLIIRRNQWPSQRDAEAAAARANAAAADMAADVRWIRTYVLAEEDGTLGAVCIYQATSADKVVEHSDCSKMTADQVILIGDLVVVNPDPTPAA